MTDIKDLLNRAIGDEPPIGIDRDEVFRAGRRRVRRRKTLGAVGVVTAVVVAAVGAATLTNFVTTPPEPMPPAMGDSQHAPPGPDLPLTSTTAYPPGTSLTPARADELTNLLYQSADVTRDVAFAWPGNGGTPAFRVANGVYLYEADVRSPKREGVLEVTVGQAAPGAPTTCADIEESTVCEVVAIAGQQVARATWKSATGEHRNLAVVVLPDGTKVAAMSSNLSRRYADMGKHATGDDPVLDLAQLTRLITKSGFRAR
jgi:hypothetical protein